MLIVSAPTTFSPVAQSVKCHNLFIPHTIPLKIHQRWLNNLSVKKTTEVIPNSKDFEGNNSKIL